MNNIIGTALNYLMAEASDLEYLESEAYPRNTMATCKDIRSRSGSLSSSSPTVIPKEESLSMACEGEGIPLLSKRIEQKKLGMKIFQSV